MVPKTLLYYIIVWALMEIVYSIFIGMIVGMIASNTQYLPDRDFAKKN